MNYSANELQEFFKKIHDDHGYDFRNYAIDSMARRIKFAMETMGIKSLPELTLQVHKNLPFFNELLQFLTVPTTEMFRDPTLFTTFREKIVPILKTYHSPRLWIAGCSTGEEVLSYAIILKEEDLLDRCIIYATDINNYRLQFARNAIYGIEKMKLNSENYNASNGRSSLSDYYNVHQNYVRFDSSLLDNVTFSQHCLVTDSSFSEFQYISCRNVLIYFNKILQDRVLHLFDDSLGTLGFLALGGREELRFSDVAKKLSEFGNGNIFRKKEISNGF